MDALPTRFAIRSALDKDLPSLPGIESAADEVFCEHGIGPLPPPANVEAYRSAVFVLVAGDPPIGFVRVVEIDGEAHLEQMSVVPTQTRKGVGGQLLRACIDSARARGFARLTLITFARSCVEWEILFGQRIQAIIGTDARIRATSGARAAAWTGPIGHANSPCIGPRRKLSAISRFHMTRTTRKPYTENS
jgi:GNAT superfamily N-acetyltransferase